jgi:transcription termination factor Rho
MSNFEYLEKMGIYDLRNLGREVGVKSPTSKAKKEIIEEIIQIKTGLKEPAPKSKKGAPPKTNFMMNKLSIEALENKDDSPEKMPYGQKQQIEETVQVNDHAVSYDSKLVGGIIEAHQNGYAFLRSNNYEPSKDDIYVSLQMMRSFKLMRGDQISGYAKCLRENGSPALTEIISINDLPPEKTKVRKYFDDLVPYFPTERLKLEIEGSGDLSIRSLDILAPVGKGQRGLIVSPPKAGKTTILKKIADSIEKNYSDVYLIVLLIDERPEEVTDIKRSVKGDVIYSTFDEMPEHHIHAAELVLSRAKRLVECGKDVVILLDSITKLARSYNNTIASSGRTLSGGLDPTALQGPKRFFGAARNIENGGSLTILATALVDTGSRMDDVIYEEFKGTGNMEIHLSRELSERRIFPAIDLFKSGTRRDDLLLTEKEQDCAFKIRRLLSKENASENFFDMMKRTKTNIEFVDKFDEWMKIYNKR